MAILIVITVITIPNIEKQASFKAHFGVGYDGNWNNNPITKSIVKSRVFHRVDELRDEAKKACDQATLVGQQQSPTEESLNDALQKCIDATSDAEKAEGLAKNRFPDKQVPKGRALRGPIIFSL